jgi:hypothetical protein
MGIYASFGLFWAIPNALLAAAWAMPPINGIGNREGFIGPYAAHHIRDATGAGEK